MRAYKFRIYPNKGQNKKIDYILDLSHNLYNAMLEQRKMAYELKKDFYYNINVNYLKNIPLLDPRLLYLLKSMLMYWI